MKIYNYSDIPVSINGHSVSDTQIVLDNEIRKPFVTHNGYEFLSNQNTESRLEAYYIINGTSSGSYKYYVDILEVPDIWGPLAAFISAFGFLILIKVIQKLRTR